MRPKDAESLIVGSLKNFTPTAIETDAIRSCVVDSLTKAKTNKRSSIVTSGNANMGAGFDSPSTQFFTGMGNATKLQRSTGKSKASEFEELEIEEY